MYKVLAADDEVWIRRWLEKTIPEVMPDCRVAAVAEDGEAALRALREEEIDIVVSDIRMPMATGLEIALAAGKSEKRPKVILVSGYDEFGYAKQAIDLNVVSYLLKPIDKQELQQVLQRAAAEIRQEEARAGSAELVQAAILKYLQNYLQQPEEYTFQELARAVKSAGKRYEAVYAGVFQCDISLEKGATPAQVIDRLLERHFAACDRFVVLEDNMNYVFFALGEEGKKVVGPDPRLLRAEAQQASPKCRLELSGRYGQLADLPAAVAQARGRLIESYASEKSAAVVDTSRGRILAIRSSILLAVKAHNPGEAEHDVQLLREMFSGRNSHFDDCRYILFSLISEMIRMIADADGSFMNQYIGRGYEFCVKINHYHNVPAMLDWFAGYVRQVAEYLEKNQSFNVSHIAVRVRNYMLEHYAEDISLADICDKFGINASYFSKKFKEEIGMNFVDLLTSIRLDAAAQLLLNTKNSVAQISKSVGINDAKYFSKLFHNSYGMNPTQYREQGAG